MSIKERLGLSQDPLFLVDGHAFIYRFFYANPDFRRSDGLPVNSLFQVLRMLLTLIRDENPRHLVFLMDGKGPTFRHEAYPDYKAQRPPMPEDLAAQLDPIRQAVQALGFKLIVSEGGEADDCIASLAMRHKAHMPVVILGADKDLNQCLDENVFIWDPGQRREKLVTLADFRSETGLEPSQWPDYQALIGDSADNIPGAPGIGPKTAAVVMDGRTSLEAIRDDLDSLKPAQRKKIEPVMDKLFLFRTLTTLRTDLCDADLDQLAWHRPDREAVAEFLRRFEMRALLRDLDSYLPRPDGASRPRTAKAKGPSEGGQFNLLAQASPAADRPDPVAAADLPDPTGAGVGLVPAEDGWLVFLDGKEHLVRGPASELAGRLAGDLAGAALVAVPSVKELLASDSGWEAVPGSAWFDLGLAAYLLRPEDRSYDFDHLRRRFDHHLEDPAAPASKAALDLAKVLAGLLDGAGLSDLMRRVEMPLIPVLARMERAGVHIDRSAFAAFLGEVQARLDELEAAIKDAAGADFNPRSSQQLAEILFTKLGLKPRGKTPGGVPSTSVAVLEKLQGEHPVVNLVLDFRTQEKLRSTYLEPLPRLAGADGRIHTTFNQLATATGRLSSSEPNLQNIPIRGEQGPRMRACFTAGEGNLLAAADYSQIELRVLAHFSGEPALIDAFNHGRDIHASTAALVFDADQGEVTSDQRRSAKTINFGLIYGMGPQKLARSLGITLAEAKEFIARYFERLPGLKDFFDSVEAQARKQAFVTTLAGRRRLLPDINSTNKQLQSQARRQAVNTLIQGSAADIIKLAMLAADADPELAELKARLILQVHDELLLEAPADSARQAGQRLVDIMSTVSDLDVPLAVDWGVGKTWAEAH